MATTAGGGVGRPLGNDRWVQRRGCGAVEGWVVMCRDLCVRVGLWPDSIRYGAGGRCAACSLLDVYPDIEVLPSMRGWLAGDAMVHILVVVIDLHRTYERDKRKTLEERISTRLGI